MADWTDCDRVCIACKTVQKTEWCDCGCDIPTRPTLDELLKRPPVHIDRSGEA